VVGVEPVVGEVELVLATKVAGEVELVLVTKLAGEVDLVLATKVAGEVVQVMLNMEALAGEPVPRRLPTSDGLETDCGDSGW
jgi:hypothetical protein